MPLFPYAHRSRWELPSSAFVLSPAARRAAIVLGLSGIIASVAISGCRSAAGTTDAKAATVPSAQVVTAQSGDISQMLTLAGQFQPYQVVDVHPKVSGYMKHINVDIGDVVHQGQTLAVLEVPELKAQLQQTVFEMQQSNDELTRAQHEINRAAATHAALHSQYERLKQTSEAQPGLVAQQELDDAQAKDLSAEAQVDSAKSAMAAAKGHAGSAQADNQRVQALHDYTNVTAPLDGVVIWRYADTGALIQGGTNSNSQDLPIVRISQSGLLRLRVPVPEDDIKFVHLGDLLQVRVDAIGRSLTGKIVRFTRDVNFETRTMETEVDVENRDLSIAPGMYANTALRLAHVSGVVTIPVEALVLNGRRQTVYVLDSRNHVHLRDVQVGLMGTTLAEIKQGLSPGERVLNGGQDKYHEDEEVSALPVASPASETVHESGGMIDLKGEEASENAGGSH
ncbi:MAG TPA: efflux RND transporter periplasmic adaptor subunit [Terracidiphilus sp.]|jgi:RND family efflux transporter MFP subunit|nr:efflux RND transporter periplasmic adaptor subunit [Terracidiphilus sp.]